MGNETSSSSSSKQKKLAFDRLDSDSDNLLTLDKLLSLPTERGVTLGIENSPLLLFRFDEGQDGAIDFAEWQKLLEHIQDAQKRVAKLRKIKQRQQQHAKKEKKEKEKEFSLSTSSSAIGGDSSTTPSYGKVWTSVTRATVSDNFDLSREGETPAFTGRGQMDYDTVNTKEEEALAELAEIQEELKQEAKRFLDKITATPKGRKRVISWLWNLADVDKSNSINLHELMQLLKALRIDGIMAQDLSFVSRSSTKKHKDRDNSKDGEQKEKDKDSKEKDREKEKEKEKDRDKEREKTRDREREKEKGTPKEERREKESREKKEKEKERERGDESGDSEESTEEEEAPSPPLPMTETSIAQELMNQYDVDGDGVLRKSDFKNLANMVISHYRKRNFNKEQKVGNFVLKRVLGTGAFGTVHFAIEATTEEEKAIKILGKGDVNDMSRVDTEIKAMMMLQHKNVARLEGVMEGQEYVFFNMELCGGGTLSHFMQGRPLSEEVARYFFHQIVEGTAYSHAAGVCHRDLKLDNILLNNESVVKIADFGHAGVYQTGWDIFSTPLVGGLSHVAPEQIKGIAYSGEKNDIWSLGVILYTMLFASPPFSGATPKEMFDEILCAHIIFPEKKAITTSAKRLILAMLHVQNEKRPTCDDILQHPWMKKLQPGAPPPSVHIDRFTIPVRSSLLVWSHADPYHDMCHLLVNIGFVTLYGKEKKGQKSPKVKCQNPDLYLQCVFYLQKKKGTDEFQFQFKLQDGMASDMIGMRQLLKQEISDREKKLQKRLQDREKEKEIQLIEAKVRREERERKLHEFEAEVKRNVKDKERVEKRGYEKVKREGEKKNRLVTSAPSYRDVSRSNAIDLPSPNKRKKKKKLNNTPTKELRAVLRRRRSSSSSSSSSSEPFYQRLLFGKKKSKDDSYATNTKFQPPVTRTPPRPISPSPRKERELHRRVLPHSMSQSTPNSNFLRRDTQNTPEEDTEDADSEATESHVVEKDFKRSLFDKDGENEEDSASDKAERDSLTEESLQSAPSSVQNNHLLRVSRTNFHRSLSRGEEDLFDAVSEAESEQFDPPMRGSSGPSKSLSSRLRISKVEDDIDAVSEADSEGAPVAVHVRSVDARGKPISLRSVLEVEIENASESDSLSLGLIHERAIERVKSTDKKRKAPRRGHERHE